MILAASLFLSLGCVSEETPYNNGNTNTDPETESSEVGYLNFVNFSISVNIEGEIISKAEEGSDGTDSAINTDSFIISIYSVKLDEVVYTSTLKELDELEEDLILNVGDYKISVYSVDPEKEELCAWDYPVYSCTKEITIISNETTTIDDFECTLSNIKTSVELSADLQDLFQDDATAEIPLNVAISLGESTLNYSRTEERCGYFKAVEESNELVVSLSGMYNLAADGEPDNYTKIEGWKQTITGVTAGQWRKISLRVENANDGNITFEIVVETWTYDKTIDVDIQTISFSVAGLVEDSIYDPDDETTDLNSPVVTLADGSNGTTHDIEDTFMVTSDIFDFDYEVCSDIIKAYITPTSGSTVASIDITVSSTSTSLMEALEGVGYEDGEISVWPTNNISDFVTISESNGTVTATVKNSTMFTLYEFLGEHTIKILAIDSEGRRSYTYLYIKCVNGDGPSVEWQGNYDFDTRYEITSSTTLPVIINITSESGITDFLVRINSDVLSQSELQGMNLDTEMDLINPATDLMSAALADLGFPVEDDVEGATELTLNITEFMPLLALLGVGETTFDLEVSDATGTVIRQIKLNSVAE